MSGLNQAQAALPVRANVVHLQQVILNLAVNGMDAMACRDPGSRRLTLETALAGDTDVEVSVSDSGNDCAEILVGGENFLRQCMSSRDCFPDESCVRNQCVQNGGIGSCISDVDCPPGDVRTHRGRR